MALESLLLYCSSVDYILTEPVTLKEIDLLACQANKRGYLQLFINKFWKIVANETSKIIGDKENEKKILS